MMSDFQPYKLAFCIFHIRYNLRDVLLLFFHIGPFIYHELVLNNPLEFDPKSKVNREISYINFTTGYKTIKRSGRCVEIKVALTTKRSLSSRQERCMVLPTGRSSSEK